MAKSSLPEVNTSIFVQIVDNLPREMICLIVSHLSVSYLKTFRLACFQYKYLYDHFYDVVTEEIKKRCVLNFNLSGIDDHPFILSKTLTSYYSVVMKSSFMISLKKSDLSNVQSLFILFAMKRFVFKLCHCCSLSKSS